MPDGSWGAGPDGAWKDPGGEAESLWLCCPSPGPGAAGGARPGCCEGSGRLKAKHGEELQGGRVWPSICGQNFNPGAASVWEPCSRFSLHFIPGSEMIETQEDIYVGSIETDRGVREQVRFYDTRGLRDGAELPRHCFSCTDGYVLVYSTDSRESFQRVELLKKEIDKSKDKKEVTIVVLGNKCDLQEQRRVDPDVAQHWAKSEKVKLWEVSVADRRSLLEPFIYLASKMTQPQSKSAFPLSRKNKGSGSLDG
ncbi:NF-kappa-B inhibitor-interacting Ras-like protein 2 isoform X1 [Ailuropoda melanoleuca]|uniref:NF-kappa-B inhibitor-interacting Ras-like protein 2 isoform X1 n=1 Tax=Ailuropoda melanoleuca TaxID=9646 RepID=UPI001494959E|nr:NF-kappa-B inhibitor-interacting Ras-like protein 2 isoform X1 [Ailuropoda melanoleuca]